MSDIFGRSILRREKSLSAGQIINIIKKYATSGLNLVDVDPGEIVVFEDENGKLKTSNLSLDDLLTKQPTAEDHSIVVFKQGKLEPSYKITDFSDKFDTITNISVLAKAAMDHLVSLRNEFSPLKRNFTFTDNAIEKFFGKKNIKPDDVKTTLADITTGQQKSTDDIQDIYSHLGVWADPKTITESIAIVNKDICDLRTITDAVKEDFPKIAPKLNKVKIQHEEKDIKNLVYMIDQGVKDWAHPESGDMDRDSLIFLDKITIRGIYRFTIISEHKFNIIMDISGNKAEGVNTIMMFIDTNTLKDRVVIPLTSVDATVVRVSVRWVLEFISTI